MVPVVLGFEPTESVVMLTFGGARALPRPGRPARSPRRDRRGGRLAARPGARAPGAQRGLRRLHRRRPVRRPAGPPAAGPGLRARPGSRWSRRCATDGERWYPPRSTRGPGVGCAVRRVGAPVPGRSPSATAGSSTRSREELAATRSHPGRRSAGGRRPRERRRGAVRRPSDGRAAWSGRHVARRPVHRRPRGGPAAARAHSSWRPRRRLGAVSPGDRARTTSALWTDVVQRSPDRLVAGAGGAAGVRRLAVGPGCARVVRRRPVPGGRPGLLAGRPGRRAARRDAVRPSAWDRAGPRARSAEDEDDRAAGTLGYGTRTLGVEEELLLFDPTTRTVAPRAGEVLRSSASTGANAAGRRRRRPTSSTRSCSGTRSRPAPIPTPRPATTLAGSSSRRAVPRARPPGPPGWPRSPAPPSRSPGTSRWSPRTTATATWSRRTARWRGPAAPAACTCTSTSTPTRRGSACIDRIAPWLPVLLAMSSNSPYVDGRDTGYASWRAQVWTRWPSAGPTEPFGSAAGYRARQCAAHDGGAARDPGMLYFDARLAVGHPTVEVRVLRRVHRRRGHRAARGAGARPGRDRGRAVVGGSAAARVAVGGAARRGLAGVADGRQRRRCCIRSSASCGRRGRWWRSWSSTSAARSRRPVTWTGCGTARARAARQRRDPAACGLRADRHRSRRVVDDLIERTESPRGPARRPRGQRTRVAPWAKRSRHRSSPGPTARGYREKVRRCLDVFARMLREARFDTDDPMTGLEVELNLVDERGDPALKNAEALEAIADPDFQTELGQFNIEINVAAGQAPRGRARRRSRTACAAASTTPRRSPPRSAPTW